MTDKTFKEIYRKKLVNSIKAFYLVYALFIPFLLIYIFTDAFMSVTVYLMIVVIIAPLLYPILDAIASWIELWLHKRKNK